MTEQTDPVSMYMKLAERIYDQLGTGHTEYIYHRAMEVELRSMGINYESERRVLITYRIGEKIYTLGEERIDIYDHTNRIIVELKAVTNSTDTMIQGLDISSDISSVNKYIDQIRKYDRFLQKIGITSEYGILINFPQSGAKPAKQMVDLISIALRKKPIVKVSKC